MNPKTLSVLFLGVAIFSGFAYFTAQENTKQQDMAAMPAGVEVAVEPASGENVVAGISAEEADMVAPVEQEVTPVETVAKRAAAPVEEKVAEEVTEVVEEANIEPEQAPAEVIETVVADEDVMGAGEDFYTIRAIGDEDAPVVMQEFSSMTCPHCATFHSTKLQMLKKEYVEKGILRVVFRDYPLNKPALDAAIIARCFAPEKYYDFISVLFETQKEWAFGDSPEKLFQTAKLAGLSDERLDACLNDKEALRFILMEMKDSGSKWKVESTPSFVFNDGAKSLKGNGSMAEFRTVIEGLAEEAKK